MTFALFLILISLFLVQFRRRRNIYIYSPPTIAAFIIFFVKFYILLKDLKYAPSYLNPFSLVILSGGIPLGIFVTIFASKQMSFVFMGLTTKQYESINREMISDLEKGDYRYSLRNKIPLKEKIINLVKFLKKRITKSIINIDK